MVRYVAKILKKGAGLVEFTYRTNGEAENLFSGSIESDSVCPGKGAPSLNPLVTYSEVEQAVKDYREGKLVQARAEMINHWEMINH